MDRFSAGRITSREIPLQFVKFACGSQVGLATLAAAERRYTFCVGLGVLVGNGWVEDAPGIGGRRQSRWRSLLPAALLSLNFFFGRPIIDSETGATFFFVLKGHKRESLASAAPMLLGLLSSLAVDSDGAGSN